MTIFLILAFEGCCNFVLFIKTYQLIYKNLMRKKHAPTELLRSSKKFIYKGKCGTVTK